MTAEASLWPTLLRAGAFGALKGGHPGEPALGLTVPIPEVATLMSVLKTLSEQRVRATLLVPPTLSEHAYSLQQAVREGHELAGWGTGLHPTRLEVAAGQPIRFWALERAQLSHERLARLTASGLSLLPLPVERPEPGGILRVQLEELAAQVQRFRQLEYRPGPVGELPDLRQARGRDLFQYWYIRALEEPYARSQHMLDLSERAGGVMRVAALDHAPPPLPLPRQTPTAELHLNSARLVGLTSRSVIGTYRTYQRNLRDVGLALEERPELADAQAVFAVTLLHPVLEKAGFRMLNLPPLRARWYGLGFRVLRMAYGTMGAPSDGIPRLGWLPRDAFLERYGS